MKLIKRPIISPIKRSVLLMPLISSSIDGGIASTTVFDTVYDGELASTTVFDTTLDGGTA